MPGAAPGSERTRRARTRLPGWGSGPSGPGSPGQPLSASRAGLGRDTARGSGFGDLEARAELQAPLRFLSPPVFPVLSPRSPAVASPRPLLTVGLRRRRCGFFGAARGAARGEAKPIFTDRQGNSRRGSLRSRGGSKGRGGARGGGAGAARRAATPGRVR